MSVPIPSMVFCSSCWKICSFCDKYEWHKNKHSLCAIDASELFEASAPEKVIKVRTGNHSLEALHVAPPIKEQQQAVSAILSAQRKTMLSRSYEFNSMINTSIHLQSLYKVQDLIIPNHNCTFVINAAPIWTKNNSYLKWTCKTKNTYHTYKLLAVTNFLLTLNRLAEGSCCSYVQ